MRGARGAASVDLARQHLVEDLGNALAGQLDQQLDQASQQSAKLLAGEADLKRGAARAALDNFNAARKILDTWLARDGLGRAYLMANAFPDAQTEFDASLRRKGEATTVLLDDIPTYRLLASTRFYIARAQEGQKSPAAAASLKARRTSTSSPLTTR